MRRIWGIAGALVLLGLAACGGDDTTIAASGDPSDPAPFSTEPRAPDPDQRYRWRGFVLEDEEHGPLLCLGLLDSLPPQCDESPGVVGFDWSAVEHEQLHSTRWGTFELIGTWDGATLTLTDPPRRYEFPTPPTVAQSAMPMPCHEPSIGKRAPTDAVDPDYDYVSAQRDWAGAWWSGDVYVTAFTGDLDSHRKALSSLVDGPFCVTSSPRTHRELDAMMVMLAQEHDAVRSAMALDRGGIDLTLWVDDPILQAEFDKHYGPDVVRVFGHLEPVES